MTPISVTRHASLFPITAALGARGDGEEELVVLAAAQRIVGRRALRHGHRLERDPRADPALVQHVTQVLEEPVGHVDRAARETLAHELRPGPVRREWRTLSQRE